MKLTNKTLIPSNREVHNQRRKKSMKLGCLGTLLVSIAYITAQIDPLDRILKDQLSLRNGSFLFNLWVKPPLEVFIKVYIFNITNSLEFTSGVDEKLKISEIGPYVYQEFLEHQNITFNENGTVSYFPVRRVIPIPERSIGDPLKDIIVAPNLPLLGLSTAISKVSSFAAFAISSLAKTLKAKPILNLTVHDYLWGYEDNLVRFASNIAPNIISFEKFGLMDRLFDDGSNLVSINLPKSLDKDDNTNAQQNTEIFEDTPVSEYLQAKKQGENESDEEFKEIPLRNNLSTLTHKPQEEGDLNFGPIRDFSIDQWNGSPGLREWGYVNTPDTNKNLRELKNIPCNTLRGAFDGTLFPKNITRNEVFRVYRKAFCRTLPIKFTHAGKLNKIDAYWFALSDGAFDDSLDDPDSKCYCEKKQCLRRGLGSITPCYYNIPTAVSLPHFYKADSTLQNEVIGLTPMAERHDSTIILQPRIGIPMKVNSRIQINLIMGDTKFNKDIKMFENIVIPIFWLEIAIEKLTPNLQFLLQMLFNVFPLIQIIFIYLMALIGVSMFATAAISSCLSPRVSEIYYNNTQMDIKYSAIDSRYICKINSLNSKNNGHRMETV